VDQAQLNVQWTQVRASITGRMSRTLVTRGNLIVANQTMLTTIVSQDPMFAYFDVDEPTMLRVQRLIREGKFTPARAESAPRNLPVVGATAAGLLASPGIPASLLAAPALVAGRLAWRGKVYLSLANEEDFPHVGYVDFVNNVVDPSTGTLQVRGVFANPRPAVGDRLLSPGQFVRIRVHIGPPHPALLVPQGAIGTDQNIQYVYVVDEQNKVVRRDVKLGIEQEGMQVIEGVRPDERVIIEGVQHVHPGAVVQPKLVELAGSNSKSEAPNPKQIPMSESQ
jgi:multidrug efflux system membrane fusion protein